MCLLVAASTLQSAQPAVSSREIAGVPPQALEKSTHKGTPFFISAEARVWLPSNRLFEDGAGLIAEDEKIQFMGFRLLGGRSISENNRHWIYASLNYGLGTYKRKAQIEGTPSTPVSPHYSDHLLSGNDMMQLGLVAGYKYTYPLTSCLSLTADTYLGVCLVGIFDEYKGYHDIHDPYYEESFNEEDWADNMDLGFCTGISIGVQYQFTETFFMYASYGIEFQSSNPSYHFSNGATARTRHTAYQTISVSFGLSF